MQLKIMHERYEMSDTSVFQGSGVCNPSGTETAKTATYSFKLIHA
jgi:hypothetical protein